MFLLASSPAKAPARSALPAPVDAFFPARLCLHRSRYSHRSQYPENKNRTCHGRYRHSPVFRGICMPHRYLHLSFVIRRRDHKCRVIRSSLINLSKDRQLPLLFKACAAHGFTSGAITVRCSVNSSMADLHFAIVRLLPPLLFIVNPQTLESTFSLLFILFALSFRL